MSDDATDKPKKTLPRRNTDQATLLFNAEQYGVLFNSAPPLPTKLDRERPCLLLVDDDPGFLVHIQQDWQKHYRSAFELITRYSAEGNVVDWIEERLQNKQRLDALFIDKHLGEGGASTKDYLEQLRENTATEFLPVVVVTTSEFGTDEKDRRAFLQYAQWILYRKEATPAFLYQMATSLPSALDAAEDRIWASTQSFLK